LSITRLYIYINIEAYVMTPIDIDYL